MRRALPFALWTAVSVALLGFLAVFGLRTVGVGAPTDFPGWQVTATRVALLGLAVLLGGYAGLRSWRQLRGLQGEGLVVGVPAVLTGLLLSGLPTWGAGHAVSWAERRTASYQDASRQLEQALADSQQHPIRLRPSEPAASAADASRLVQLSDLGPSWYAGQTPPVTRSTGSLSTGVHTTLVKATRRTSGWDIHRWLVEHVDAYPTAALAQEHLRERLGDPRDRTPGPVGRLRVGAAEFTVLRTSGVPARVDAVLRRGATVWSVSYRSGQPADPLTENELRSVLALVARRAT